MTLSLDSPIYVAGHNGMVGSALVRALRQKGIATWWCAPQQNSTCVTKGRCTILATTRPTQVYLAAAKVGGIHANSTQPADFLHDNLAIQTNVIEGSRRASVDKLLFLGSSCIYPKHTPQPIQEDALLTGALEPTNAPYAVAKIAGLHMCDAYRAQHGCNFISAMPTNLYGPGDNYHPEHSHVLPALIRRFHEAKQQGLPAVTCWGTGRPMREFLHVDDLASACLHFVHNEPGWVNVGTGSDLSIANLAHMVAQTVDFKGQILWDRSKPDGTPRKWLDVSRLAELGWTSSISLEEGLRTTYEDFLAAHVSNSLRC